MPGIAGLITKLPAAEARSRLGRMLATMQHESFYRTSSLSVEQLGVYAGIVEHDNLPHVGGSHELGDDGLILDCLVFAGEAQVEDGERGSSRFLSGIQWLAAGAWPGLAEQSSNGLLSSLNGQFHGLLIEQKQGRATLFNDRYGARRLYVRSTPEAVYFAAEAKAILAVCPECRAMEPDAFAELVALGCTVNNKSVFQGIKVLPPASAWLFREGQLESVGRYFDPADWEQQTELDPETYYREVRASFVSALDGCFEASGRVGLSLTGGLDTRTVLAWHKPGAEDLPCYTFGSSLRENRDVRIARQVAKQRNLSHEVLVLGKDYLARFAHYAARAVYLTDGMVGVNFSPDLYLNERARSIAPVRVTGNYGDQVMLHRPALKLNAPAVGLFADWVTEGRAAASEALAQLAVAHPLTRVVFEDIPWHYHGLLALESTQVRVRTPFLDNKLVKLLYRAPGAALQGNGLRLRLIEDGSPELRKIRADRGAAGRGGRLGEILSTAVHNTSFRAEYAFDRGMPQWLARVDHLLEPLHLERAFLGRHKFAHFRSWYRDELVGCVREVLLDPRSLARPYLQRKTVESMVATHTRGIENHCYAIHQLLTLEFLHRELIDCL